VFTSFTLSQAGMAKHHLTHKEPGWRRGIFVNGVGAVLSLVVDIIIAITKFTHGAWAIVVLVPVMVLFLVRLARQYGTEAEQLEHDLPVALTAPILRRHVVLVFVDKLDLAAARAIQYARTLTPDELRAVHFALDPQRAAELAEAWTQAGMSRVALDLVNCPDRRLTRAAVELVARDLADGETEVSVLLPDRKYRGVWNRILHDQTANAIERDVSQLPHANVTTVPFHFGPHHEARTGFALRRSAARPARTDRGRTATESTDGSTPGATPARAGEITPIAAVRWRDQVVVHGQVQTLRVKPTDASHILECIIDDGTGALSVVFFGRSRIGGIDVGTWLEVVGTAGEHRGRLAIFNPTYTLTADHRE
jgi:hypothetical protein